MVWIANAWDQFRLSPWRWLWPFCFVLKRNPLNWTWKRWIPNRIAYHRKNFEHSNGTGESLSCEIWAELIWPAKAEMIWPVQAELNWIGRRPVAVCVYMWALIWSRRLRMVQPCCFGAVIYWFRFLARWLHSECLHVRVFPLPYLAALGCYKCKYCALQPRSYRLFLFRNSCSGRLLDLPTFQLVSYLVRCCPWTYK